ncbi:MAG: transglutaminase domain-containing protein [Oscillospiraceae bacterium]
MKKLNFTFTTKLTFDDYVREHSIALRCVPPETETQRILSCELSIKPFVSTCQTVDAFGNNVTAGYLKSEHRFLDFEIRGCAEIDSSQKRSDFMPCYCYQSKFTKPDDKLRNFYNYLKESRIAGSPEERCAFFSDKLNEFFIYEKNSTTIKTTAAEAFEQKKGVCQDFTHIMLSLLRMDGIPCRYIAGLASCDGETHSWLEYWNGEHWLGFDPTNNCAVTDNYLTLSQGRDFGDCAIDRGVMLGNYTRQMQLINSCLSE